MLSKTEALTRFMAENKRGAVTLWRLSAWDESKKIQDNVAPLKFESYGHARAFADRYKLDYAKQSYKKIVVDNIDKLMSMGIPVIKIAELLGVSYAGVYKQLRKGKKK